jgi:hypothetical protein
LEVVVLEVVVLEVVVMEVVVVQVVRTATPQCPHRHRRGSPG